MYYILFKNSIKKKRHIDHYFLEVWDFPGSPDHSNIMVEM